jgi:hypothetical protein
VCANSRKKGSLGDRARDVQSPYPPLSVQAGLRLHGPPYPARAKKDKVSTIGEMSHGSKPDREIEDSSIASQALGCAAIDLKRHWHKMLTDLMIIRNVNIESKTRIKGKPLDK